MAGQHAHAEKPDLRIVLVGKTGTGKSATANTILGEKAFASRLSFSPVTEWYQQGSCRFDGQKLTVVDTPGLFEIEKKPEELKNALIQCYFSSAPGPHVFLIVMEAGRFTKEDQETVEFIQNLFGKESSRYTMALFTHGDALKEEEVIIESLFDNQALNDFIRQCGGGYHVFNNKTNDESQVSELLKKINTMIENNGGSYYTNEIFDKAIKERMEQIQKDDPNLTPEEARKKAEEYSWFTWSAAATAAATTATTTTTKTAAAATTAAATTTTTATATDAATTTAAATATKTTTAITTATDAATTTASTTTTRTATTTATAAAAVTAAVVAVVAIAVKVRARVIQ